MSVSKHASDSDDTIDQDNELMDMYELFFASSSSDDEPEPKRRRGGSKPGRKRNLDRQFIEAEARFRRMYLSGTASTYTDKQFRRRFRMRRELFQRIFDGVVETDNYFTTKQDAVCSKVSKLSFSDCVNVLLCVHIW